MRSLRGSATVALASEREIVITRTFRAPAELVFEAWTTPEHVERWWGSEEAPMVVCEIDLRVGGRWRYVTREPDGTELGWHGTFREILAPTRVVSTEVFEGSASAETVNTATVVERGDVTDLTITVLHATREDRDRHLRSGMAEGLQRTFDRLDELVVTMHEATGAAPGRNEEQGHE